MDQLLQVIDTLRAHLLLAAFIAMALLAGYALLHRRPKIQREADERLSALRRDKPDRYTKPRPPH